MIGMIASIAGTLKLQALQQKIVKPSDLDTTLLAAAQAGVYLHCLFGVVGDILTMGPTWALSLITDLLALMQSTSQTLLIKVRNWFVSFRERNFGHIYQLGRSMVPSVEKFADRLGKTLLEKRQARQGINHIPYSRQHRVVDGEHSGEVSRGGSPGPSSILRSVGMDHHHPRVHAIGYILSVPLGHMPVRDMEDVLQMQIEQRRPHPLLNSPRFLRNFLDRNFLPR